MLNDGFFIQNDNGIKINKEGIETQGEIKLSMDENGLVLIGEEIYIKEENGDVIGGPYKKIIMTTNGVKTFK